MTARSELWHELVQTLLTQQFLAILGNQPGEQVVGVSKPVDNYGALVQMRRFIQSCSAVEPDQAQAPLRKPSGRSRPERIFRSVFRLFCSGQVETLPQKRRL